MQRIRLPEQASLVFVEHRPSWMNSMVTSSAPASSAAACPSPVMPSGKTLTSKMFPGPPVPRTTALAA